MLTLALTVGFASQSPLPAIALTDAASGLVAQEVEAACGTDPGRYDPGFVVERDLDGDGTADLLVAHEGIECAAAARSALCGETACPIRIWLRRGDGFTSALDGVSGYDMTIGAGPVPEIRWVTENGAPAAVRWDGGAFR